MPGKRSLRIGHELTFWCMEDKLGGRGARWAEEGWWWETNGSNLGGGAVPTVQWEREMGVIRAVFKKV